MSYFKAKMHKVQFRLGSAQTPLQELTALPQTPYSWIQGVLLLREGEGWEGKEEGEEGGGRGRERGKGMDASWLSGDGHPCHFLIGSDFRRLCLRRLCPGGWISQLEVIFRQKMPIAWAFLPEKWDG